MPKLERDLQCISEARGLDLHVIAQLQFLGIRMQVHLLVHSVGHRVAVQVMPEPVRSHFSDKIMGGEPCFHKSGVFVDLDPLTAKETRIGEQVLDQVHAPHAEYGLDQWLSPRCSVLPWLEAAGSWHLHRAPDQPAGPGAVARAMSMPQCPRLFRRTKTLATISRLARRSKMAATGPRDKMTRMIRWASRSPTGRAKVPLDSAAPRLRYRG
jgi:hypothetical protein